MKEPRLTHTHIIKLGRLLNMLYKPSELAEELGLAQEIIYRSYIPAGLPHFRDASNHIWIHGPAFVAWARARFMKKKSSTVELPDGHAWCMKCNQARPMTEPSIVYANRYVEILQSICPICNVRINRAQARSKGEK